MALPLPESYRTVDPWRSHLLTDSGLPIGMAHLLLIMDTDYNRLHELTIIDSIVGVTGYLDRELICEAKNSDDCAAFLVDLVVSGVKIRGKQVTGGGPHHTSNRPQ